MRAWLENEAAKSGYTIADVIRRCVGGMRWLEDNFDEQTRHLGLSVMQMAAAIQRAYPPWHRNEKAFQSLVEAIVAWLNIQEREKGEGDDSFGQDDPATVGRMIARAIHRDSLESPTQLQMDDWESTFRVAEYPRGGREPPKKGKPKK
jgi:hypothetical protein